MTKHAEEHLDLCAGYALGSLDRADLERLEDHLASGCPECEAALVELTAATTLLAASARPAEPGAGLRERVLKRARAEAPGLAGETRGTGTRAGARRSPLESPWTWTGLAAAACLVLALAWAWTWRIASERRAELEASRDRIARLEERLEEERRWGSVVDSPAARVALLDPTPAAEAAGAAALRARAVVDPGSRRAVVVFSNARAPVGRDYELWAIHGAVPASLGLISADVAGNAVVRLEDVGDPETLAALAVSLEPEGGSPAPNAPTGPVVLLGAFGR